VLNIANNHTFEYGSAIFSDTIEILENAGIQVCGRRNSTIDYYSMPVFLNIKGLEIGILGYNWIGKDKFNEADTYIAQSHDSIVNYTWNRDGVKDAELQSVVHEKNQNVIHDLRKLKQTVDFVILMTHWGFEFVHVPPLGVKLEARSFIDAGADLIIGTHPHVIQGMERYNNRSVFYSLGNFIFDSRDSKTRYTTILDMQIHDDEKIEYDFKPYYINKEFQPQYANKRQQKKLNEIIDRSTHVINSSSCTIKLNDDDIYRQYERYYNWGKISAIYHLIHAIREDRKVIAVIFRKLQNLFEVIKLQFQGRKVRW
jgi:poly-gamma-glutamate synthesis protein (capsule biosynthesis protein)